MNSNSTCDSSPCSQSVSLTCWKMQRLGKVREMSSLICSRLDSRSDEPASETRRTKLHRGRRARGKSRSEAITSVCEQTFRFRLSGGRRRVPPLFFGSRQTDAVQLCLGQSAEAQHRQCKRHRGVWALSSNHDDWTETTSEVWAHHHYSAVTERVIKGDRPQQFTSSIPH